MLSLRVFSSFSTRYLAYRSARHCVKISCPSWSLISPARKGLPSNLKSSAEYKSTLLGSWGKRSVFVMACSRDFVGFEVSMVSMRIAPLWKLIVALDL
ncbi:hypothetical protein HCN_0932 [Helicobacter cinaedi PAGU611]|nr:hypothetical protein HCN_0932 [Helicobacter cinaedi PAGU611]